MIDQTDIDPKDYAELVKYMAKIYNADYADLPQYDPHEREDNAKIAESRKNIIIERLNIPDWVVKHYEQEGIALDPGFDKHTIHEMASYLPVINPHGDVLYSLMVSSSMFGDWDIGPSIEEIVNSLAIDPTADLNLPDELIKRDLELKSLYKELDQ